MRAAKAAKPLLYMFGAGARQPGAWGGGVRDGV